MNTEPRVAILLLNWNGWQDTIECLNSILRLEYDNFSVILCDNASTDGSVDRFREWSRNPAATDSPAHRRSGQASGRSLPPAVRMTELTRAEAEAGVPPAAGARVVLVHNGGNLGFAQGNNVGLRYALARPEIDYVWILNNDVVVDGRSLAELVRCARAEPGVGGVGSTIFEYSEPDVVQAAGGGVFSRQHIIPRLITRPRRERGRPVNAPPLLDFVSGACMLVGVDELRRVGLIDEAFFIYCEDVDLGVRIRKGGRRLLHARDSKIWHKGGSTVGHRSLRHDYYTVRNLLALARKHYPATVPLVALYLVYRAVLPKILRRQWGRIGAAWRGFRDFRNRVVGPVPL
jgi:GT2 family glycosyltransferase